MERLGVLQAQRRALIESRGGPLGAMERREAEAKLTEIDAEIGRLTAPPGFQPAPTFAVPGEAGWLRPGEVR
jgi:hypothetical protein